MVVTATATSNISGHAEEATLTTLIAAMMSAETDTWSSDLSQTNAMTATSAMVTDATSTAKLSLATHAAEDQPLAQTPASRYAEMDGTWDSSLVMMEISTTVMAALASARSSMAGHAEVETGSTETLAPISAEMALWFSDPTATTVTMETMSVVTDVARLVKWRKDTLALEDPLLGPTLALRSAETV